MRGHICPHVRNKCRFRSVSDRYRQTPNKTDPKTMSSIAAGEQGVATDKSAEKAIHPTWVRVCHWTNAVAMVVMIMSGWQIYNASPLFNFVFPRTITIGGWLGGALLWHFAAMWLLMINGLVYLITGFVTGRFARKLLPITPAGVLHDVKAALTFKLSHDDLSVYNSVQRILYAGIILVGVLI